MKFKSNYELSNDPGFDQTGEFSLTVQSEADSCDINLIMQSFNRSGKLPGMQAVPPQYGDARIVDFQTAKAIVKDAEDQFMQLPALTRKTFGNDPQLFLEAINDNSDENVKKLLKLGILIEKKASPEEVLEQIAQNTKPVNSDLKIN